ERGAHRATALPTVEGPAGADGRRDRSVITEATEFLTVMKAKWAEYGNVGSPALEHVCLELQATLDYQSGPDALDVWPVIPCELGSGKTTAAKLWCAVKPVDEN